MSETADAWVVADRYELGGRLGSGGMADVHRATDRVLHREVAVKVLRETADDETDRLRFTSEARTLAALNHRHLVMVLDAGTTADQPFLVMELVEGPTLAQRAAERPLGAAEVAQIGAQLADALAYAHGQGVIHRDVKPGNVLLGKGGVKLADFGIARLVGDTVRHTKTGQAIGTAAYLAPEQVLGADLTPAADVYALGLVLLEALTGERAYPGPATEAALARLHRPPHVPDTLLAPWPALLSEMTAIEAGDRPDAGEVAARLRAPVPDDDGAGATRVMTAPTAVAEVAHPRPGAALLEKAAQTPAHLRNAAIAVAAIVLLIVVAAVASSSGSGDGGQPDGDQPDREIPADTPPDLRGPMQDLHDAVLGTGS